MRFTTYLGKTFLVFAASGAGSVFGMGLAAAGVITILRFQAKPVVEVLKAHAEGEPEKEEETK